MSGQLVTSTGPPAGIPSNLWSALSAYKTNYAAYKVTNQSSYKTAYESALAIVNKAIADSSSISTANDRFIQQFTDSYSTTNADIAKLQHQSKVIQTQGPALQDSLAQSQQLHNHVVAAADETSLYVKASIVFGLLVIVGIVGAL